MKKLVSFMLVMVLALSMSIGAFANGTDGTDIGTGEQTVTLKKTYEITGGTAPEETFDFSIENAGMTDSGMSEQPTASIDNVHFESTPVTTDANIQIHLPSFTTVGIYTYKITEANSNTAGVTNYDKPVYLIVYVTQEASGLVSQYDFRSEIVSGEKIGNTGITNKYEAGSLSVEKQVTGNMGDRSKEFTVTVTFNAPGGKNVNSTITYTDDTETESIFPNQWEDDEFTATITLKHGETVTFNNIPYGVSYTVEENNYTTVEAGGYDNPEYSREDENGEVGTIDSDSESVTVTNNKANGNIDTGIFLDNMPYIVMLVVVIAGFTAFAMKKRHSVED